METELQIFATVSFVAIGLSHVFQPQAWIEYFAKLHQLGRIGAFAEGFLYLHFGALIVALHNVWSFPACVLTIMGWGMVLKAVVRFVAPEIALRLYARMVPERAWQLQASGCVLLLIAGLLFMLNPAWNAAL